ncbi:MAG: hypothetical protein ACIARQ_02225 [Phycisphaerales bacterium JB061]
MKAIATFGLALALMAGCQSGEKECCQVPAEETAGIPEMSPPELEATIEALSLALEDERKSEAMYMAVMDVHGERRPFSMIVNSERMHQNALLKQFDRLGVEAPEAHEWAFEIPDTFEGACQMAIDAEVDNAALYDKIENQVSDESILGTFAMLRNATENCHLPAFTRAAGGDAEAGCGGSCGNGQGGGKGKGQGKGKGNGCGGEGGGCGGGGCGSA